MATKKKTPTKAAPKKAAAPKKTAARKAAPKKAAPKKAAPKKAAPKKAATKKAATKNAAPKKAAPKKAAPKKAAPKKAAAKKASSKTAAAPKAAPRFAEPKAAEPKKTTARTAEPQKAPSAPAARPEAPAPKKPVLRDPALDVAQVVAALALEKKADDVVILRVTDLTSYADGFVLASAPSERQVQAIARSVDEEMKKAGKGPVGIEGLEQGHWVLVDLGAVVLHVFLSNARRYYDLEGFWSEAPRIDVDEAYGQSILEKMRAKMQAAQAAAAG